MTSKTSQILGIIAAAGLLFTSGAVAAEDGAKNENGGRIFMRYCALCHGLDGGGQGPLSESLRTVPPDLSLISRRNDGTFPDERIRTIIKDGGDNTHGMMAMMSWAKVFDEELDEDTDEVVDALVHYLKGLQDRVSP